MLHPLFLKPRTSLFLLSNMLMKPSWLCKTVMSTSYILMMFYKILPSLVVWRAIIISLVWFPLTFVMKGLFLLQMCLDVWLDLSLSLILVCPLTSASLRLRTMLPWSVGLREGFWQVLNFSPTQVGCSLSTLFFESIDKYRKNYLWRGSDFRRKGYNLVAWNMVMKQKIKVA